MEGCRQDLSLPMPDSSASVSSAGTAGGRSGSACSGHRPFSNPLAEAHMPLYIIERNFAEKLDLNADGVVAITKINGEVGVNWLFSFLSADKRKSYCLYEAKDPEAIREAARRANVPADVIVEVSQAYGSDLRVLAAAG